MCSRRHVLDVLKEARALSYIMRGVAAALGGCGRRAGESRPDYPDANSLLFWSIAGETETAVDDFIITEVDVFRK